MTGRKLSARRPGAKHALSRATKVLALVLPLVILEVVLAAIYNFRQPDNAERQVFTSTDWYQDWKSMWTTGFETSPYIAPDKRYSVCAIPKNGCTQQKMMLHKIAGNPKYDDMKAVHRDPRRDKLVRFSDFQDDEAIAVIRNDSIPKFVVVRNPILRTLSAYVDKRGRPFLTQSREKRASMFESFVMKNFGPQHDEERQSEDPRVYCEAYRSMDQHWRPQICFCSFPVLPRLFQQFRFEEPGPMVDLIEKIVTPDVFNSGWGVKKDVNFRQNFDISNHNRTRSSSADTLFLTYYTVSAFDVVARRLREEIKLFGYQDEVKALRVLLVNQENG